MYIAILNEHVLGVHPDFKVLCNLASLTQNQADVFPLEGNGLNSYDNDKLVSLQESLGKEFESDDSEDFWGERLRLIKTIKELSPKFVWKGNPYELELQVKWKEQNSPVNPCKYRAGGNVPIVARHH